MTAAAAAAVAKDLT